MACILPGFRRTAFGLATKPSASGLLVPNLAGNLQRRVAPAIASPCLWAARAPGPVQSPLARSISRARFYSSPPPSKQGSPLSEVADKLRQNIPEHPQPAAPVNDNATTDGFTTSKSFAIFMLASALSVFGIVVFGGLTRLTESG